MISGKTGFTKYTGKSKVSAFLALQ